MKFKFAALAILLLGVAGCNPQVDQKPQQQVGRYKIVYLPRGARDVILLDTVSGQTWNLVRYVDVNGSPVVWEWMHKLDADKDFEAMVADIGVKTEPDEDYPACDSKRKTLCFSK